jgi:hypothetical protein
MTALLTIRDLQNEKLNCDNITGLLENVPFQNAGLNI